MPCRDQAVEGEDGGREARAEAALMVQVDDGGLDQGGGKGWETVRFWIHFGAGAKRTCWWIGCRVKNNPKIGAMEVLCACVHSKCTLCQGQDVAPSSA